MRIGNQKGRMKVGFAPDLYGEMILRRDWPPLCEVLEEVHRAELERKGWLKVEGWVDKEETSSLDEEALANLWIGTIGLQFKTAQEDEEEFLRIQEEEVASIQDQVLQPGLNKSDPHFEIHNVLLYKEMSSQGGLDPTVDGTAPFL